MKCPGVPPAEHPCPNLDIRESTVPARSKCEVLEMEPHRPPDHHVHAADRGAGADLEFARGIAPERPST
jgi:hypothetical protein